MGWCYFEDKDIKSYRPRRQIDSLPREGRHRQNDVETAMFQYSLHTRNGRAFISVTTVIKDNGYCFYDVCHINGTIPIYVSIGIVFHFTLIQHM